MSRSASLALVAMSLVVVACAPIEVAPPPYVLGGHIPVNYVWDSTIPGEAQARWESEGEPTIALHPEKFPRHTWSVQHFIILHEKAHLHFALNGIEQDEMAADCQAVVWMRDKAMLPSSGLAEVTEFLMDAKETDVHPPGVERANNALLCFMAE